MVSIGRGEKTEENAQKYYIETLSKPWRNIL